MDRRVETALTDLDRERPDVAAVARETWDAITGGSGDAREVSQWWLQMFCWDLLARDVDSPPEQRWLAASALGDLLERIGLRRYADIARSDTTREILLASDDPDAYSRAYAEALKASGIQPPDTPLLTWGSVMGPAEADTYERVAHALELSQVSGDVVLGRRGTAAARRKVTDAVLTSRHRGMGGERPLHRICTERLKRWTGGSATLAGLLQPLAGDLTSGIPVPVPAAADALRPMQALVHCVRDPVALTSAGYLPPSVVTAVFTRAGLARAVPGASRREADVPQVRLLRDAASRLSLVRVHRRALTLTPRGRAALDDPAALAAAVADGWFPPRRTAPVVAREVVTALLAGGSRPTPAEAGVAVLEVLAQEGWRLGDGDVPPQVAEALAWRTRRDLACLGMAAATDERWQVRDSALPVLAAALRHHLLHHPLRQQDPRE